MHTYTFHVSGTHCASCKIFIEDTLSELDFVSRVHVDLGKETVLVEASTTLGPDGLANLLTQKVASHGYALSVERAVRVTQSGDPLWKALGVGFSFLFLFVLLQKSGILNFGFGGAITPTTSFLIGLIASVSSCLAVVGGLVLSLSAKISQDNVSDTKTFTLFHIGRVIGFAMLGGVLGAVGGVLGVNFTVTAILGIVASLVMISLGLNLLGVLSKNKLTLSPGIFSFFKNIEHTTLAPLALGLATFFLPCGFTQAMQISALSSGSFTSGMSIMFMFALGTLPVLALLSFGSASLAHGKYSSLFFKSAGVVVVGLGLLSLLAGLAALGIINPLFTI
ncbi:MAG: sulfite exporter TauE/SafE family protein [Candidatus Paceibacterota bacterium]|nr:MAG: sulfite exporter TauE/SafE family protein [Candidatus Paceibacterota bacterium]